MKNVNEGKCLMLDMIASLGARDYIALAAVALAAAAAIRYMRKRRKNGGCCGSCTGCAFANECHKKDSGENGTEDKLQTGAGKNSENP